MARNTVADVRERVENLSGNIDFTCHGVGTNKYQLIDYDTGKTYGPMVEGATNFLNIIKAFEDGRRYE